MARVLVVDDDPGALRLAASALAEDHEVTPCGDGAAAITLARGGGFDLVLTDLGMPAPDGFEVLRAVTGLPEAPDVVVLTAMDCARATLDALRLGARDYIVKPSSAEEIRAAVSNALAGRCGGGTSAEYGLVGVSCAIVRLKRLIPLLARSRETVLIMGETGTGKELFARALHEHGPRAAGPFVAHNVAATPADLAESLFFGHARGAFSGAHADHPGLFEQAHGGTLFLDELDSLPLALQAKLLRTLECLRVQRVGATADREIDVRVVAASTIDPAGLVARGAFRADLYYRLRQLEVVMPPLRERMDDLPPLVAHVLAECSREQGRTYRLSAAAEALLVAHAWPGNVRELRHALRGAATLAETGAIQPQHLPRALRETGAGNSPAEAPVRLEDLEYLAIRRALERASGNQSRAAQLLGIDRGTLARKLRRFGA